MNKTKTGSKMVKLKNAPIWSTLLVLAFAVASSACTAKLNVPVYSEDVAQTTETTEEIRLGKPIPGFSFGASGCHGAFDGSGNITSCSPTATGTDSVSSQQIVVFATANEPVLNKDAVQAGADSVTGNTVRVVSGIHGVISSVSN